MSHHNRFPRSLTEAFGPYADGPIEEPRRPVDWQDRIVLAASTLTALALVLIIWS